MLQCGILKTFYKPGGVLIHPPGSYHIAVHGRYSVMARTKPITDYAIFEGCAARFWKKVVGRDCSPDGCWEWRGAHHERGYGRIKIARRFFQVHRVAWILTHGPIDADLVIDHLCGNTACVNPAHLEPVPERTNILRGDSPAARHARRDACTHGHPYTPENTRIQVPYRRRCRVCERGASQRYRARALQGGERP